MCCKSGTVNAQLSISLARARVEVMMPPARSSGPVRTQCGSELAALDPVVLQAKVGRWADTSLRCRQKKSVQRPPVPISRRIAPSASLKIRMVRLFFFGLNNIFFLK